MRRLRPTPTLTGALWGVPRTHSRGLRQVRHAQTSSDNGRADNGAWFPSLRMVLAMACGALFWEAVSSQKDHVWRWVQERLWTRLEVRSASNPDLFDALLFWCSSQTESARGANIMIAPGITLDHASTHDPSSVDRTSPMFAPGYGRHRYQSRLLCQDARGEDLPGVLASTVVVTREIDDSTRHKAPRGHGRSVDEVLTFCVGGANGRAGLAALVAEAQRVYAAEANKRIRVYHNDGGFWSFLCWRHRRPRASMELSDVQQRVLSDAERFLAAQGVYESLGVPWRRGYLLHGSPGTGKSSFIALLAGALHAQVYLLSLKDSNLTDAMLHAAVNSVPAHSVLVLEDIDSLSIDSADSGQRAGCSWSGVLNAMDGIAASEGRILFLTANRPQTLPPALLRPGRIDDTILFEGLSKAAVANMECRFRAILGGASPPKERDVVSARRPDGSSSPLKTPAEVQNDLLNTLLYGHGQRGEGCDKLSLN